MTAFFLIAALAVQAPEASLSAFGRSSKVERGMVENRDPVFGWEAEVNWYGAEVGFEACHDFTGERRGRYNELTSRVGYGYEVCRWCELAVDWAYKHAVEEHTQEIGAEVLFPCPWCVPFCRAEVDADSHAGALYGVLGVFRECEICQGLTATPSAGIGFANQRRNEADFECRRCAGRDVRAGIEFDWEVVDHVHLCPSVMLYDQLTADARSASEHNGFCCCAGCAIKSTF